MNYINKCILTFFDILFVHLNLLVNRHTEVLDQNCPNHILNKFVHYYLSSMSNQQSHFQVQQLCKDVNDDFL